MIAKHAPDELICPIDEDLIAHVLGCYFEHTTYLRDAAILEPTMRGAPSQRNPTVTAVGRFCIKESCYIEETGHFNAVEFNICFNQLAYVLYAHCFANGIFQQLLPDWGSRLNCLNSSTFDQNQLSSMLIVNLRSAFKRQINSADFEARLEISRFRFRDNSFFSKNRVRFTDPQGGLSEGEVTLAMVPPSTRAHQDHGPQ